MQKSLIASPLSSFRSPMQWVWCGGSLGVCAAAGTAMSIDMARTVMARMAIPFPLGGLFSRIGAAVARISKAGLRFALSSPMYAVKEIFHTLQGEGMNAGRPAVFLRFAGCNLWSGREEDREGAVCRFCDTQFVGTDGVGGGKFPSARALARRVANEWPAALGGGKFVVCTGGEPLLQLDIPLIDALHAQGFSIALETNGTLAV